MSGEEAQLLPFQNALGRILLGQPVAHAMKDFNERYAALSTSLSDLLERIGFSGLVVPDTELARLWTERNDAQNYVVLGDPAAAARVCLVTRALGQQQHHQDHDHDRLGDRERPDERRRLLPPPQPPLLLLGALALLEELLFAASPAGTLSTRCVTSLSSAPRSS